VDIRQLKGNFWIVWANVIVGRSFLYVSGVGHGVSRVLNCVLLFHVRV